MPQPQLHPRPFASCCPACDTPAHSGPLTLDHAGESRSFPVSGRTPGWPSAGRLAPARPAVWPSRRWLVPNLLPCPASHEVREPGAHTKLQLPHPHQPPVALSVHFAQSREAVLSQHPLLLRTLDPWPSDLPAFPAFLISKFLPIAPAPPCPPLHTTTLHTPAFSPNIWPPSNPTNDPLPFLNSQFSIARPAFHPPSSILHPLSSIIFRCGVSRPIPWAQGSNRDFLCFLPNFLAKRYYPSAGTLRLRWGAHPPRVRFDAPSRRTPNRSRAHGMVPPRWVPPKSVPRRPPGHARPVRSPIQFNRFGSAMPALPAFRLSHFLPPAPAPPCPAFHTAILHTLALSANIWPLRDPTDDPLPISQFSILN